jgi:hypothetical protein
MAHRDVFGLGLPKRGPLHGSTSILAQTFNERLQLLHNRTHDAGTTADLATPANLRLYTVQNVTQCPSAAPMRLEKRQLRT